MPSGAQKPETSTIAYTSDQGICLVNVEGSQSRCFEDPSILSMASPMWSPNGQFLAFAGYINTAESGINQLYRLDLNSGQAVLLSAGYPVSLFTFAWTGQSDSLYFVSQPEAGKGSEIYRVNIQDESLTLITTLDANVVQLLTLDSDSTQLLLTIRYHDNEFSEGGLENDLFLYEIGTGTLRQLTDDRVPKAGIGWSPDGQRIMLVQDQPGTKEAAVLIMRPDGTERKQIATITDSQYSRLNVSWSSDGRFVLYDNGGQVFIHALETGITRQLGSGNWWRTYPIWSPDNSKIAFCQYTSPGMGLFVMDANGHNARLIASDNRCQGLSWQP